MQDLIQIRELHKALTVPYGCQHSTKEVNDYETICRGESNSHVFQENCYEDHIADSFQGFNDQRILVTTHQDFSSSMKTLDVKVFNVVFCVDADDIKNRIPGELKASKI